MNIFSKINLFLGDRKSILILLAPIYLAIRMLDLVGIASVVTISASLVTGDLFRDEKLDYLHFIDSISITNKLLLILLLILFRFLGIVILKYHSLSILYNFTAELRAYITYCYLNRKFSYINKSTSSHYIQTSFDTASKVNSLLLQPVSSTIADLIFTAFVFLILGRYDPILFLIFILLGGSTFCLQRLISKNLKQAGLNDTNKSQGLLRSIQEAIYSYPESKIAGTTDYFHSKVKKLSYRLSRLRVKSQVVRLMPSQFIESGILLSIVAYTYYLVSTDQANKVIESLAILTIGLSRLYPVFSQLNNNLARIKYGVSALDK